MVCIVPCPDIRPFSYCLLNSSPKLVTSTVSLVVVISNSVIFARGLNLVFLVRINIFFVEDGAVNVSASVTSPAKGGRKGVI